MAMKIGGLDELTFRNATNQLARTKSAGEIQQLIESDPVFSHPTLHRLWIAKLHDQLAPLKGHIELFFQNLAVKYHRDIFDAVLQLDLKVQRPPANRYNYLPPFFAGLAELLGDAVPKFEEWTLNPAEDLERLAIEVGEAVGRTVELPPYEPLEGTLWNAVKVICAACRRQRVDIRAYYVDLVSAQHLETLLADGELNARQCPFCSEQVAFPTRIWISEKPFAPDTLAAISCIWRSASGEMIYQPPSGTRRKTENDHLMMYRAMGMIMPFRWPSTDEDTGPRSMNITVEYSDENLIRRLLTDEPANGGIPLAMKALWDYTASDMRTGQYPFHAAEARVAEVVSEDDSSVEWPTGGMHPIEQMEAFRRLALCFIREAVAEKVERPPAERAFFAGETCGAFRNVGQFGLARATLERAERLLAASKANPERELAEMTLRFEQGELSAATGDTTESNRLFEEMMQNMGHDHHDLTTRVAKLNIASLQALDLKQKGSYKEAIPRFYETIAGWEQLLEALASGAVAEHMQPRLHRSLSADLANLGGAFQELTRYLRVIRIMEAVAQGENPSSDDARFLKLGGIHPMQAYEIVDEGLFDILEAIFPDGISERRLFLAATSLLERALGLSVPIASWDFAAIQGHRLAHLYLEGGALEEAQKTMQNAMEAAARITDYDRLVAGSLFLAEMALNEGDGTKGLEHLREATLQHMRQLISSGHEAQTDEKTLALIRFFAHRALDRGGDTAVAALVVENLKAVTTASSMITGRPDQAGANGEEEDSTMAAKMRQREELRLRSIWQTNMKEQINVQIEALSTEIAHESASASRLDERFARWVSAVEFDLADIESFRQRLTLLGPQTTFLGGCPLGDRLWLYAIWQGGSKTAVVHVPEPTILTDAWTEHDEERLAKVAQLVLLPMDERLRALRTEDVLVISLSEEFAQLPFCALPYKEGALCEYVNLCFVNGLAMLEACLERPRLPYRSVLALGAPSRPELPDLPAALKEVEAIASLFESNGLKAHCISGEGATPDAFASSSSDCDVVHVACHAERICSADQSLALMLTPDLLRKDSGILTEGRILAEIALREGSFVNLAGCGTGLQADTGTALMSGLVPVFLVAGAGCTLASLWPIEDGPAARFQQHFYSKLLEIADPAESLSVTQRKCLTGELGDDMRSSQIWAAYQLFGSGGRIR